MPQFESTSDLLILSSEKFGSQEVRTTSLINEFATKRKVYFIESPIYGVSESPTYFLKIQPNQVTIIQPYLPSETSVFEKKRHLLELIKEFLTDEDIHSYSMWTDTPRAMPVIRSLNPEVIVYDCQKDYSESHSELEKELFQYADVVLTSALGAQRQETRDQHQELHP